MNRASDVFKDYGIIARQQAKGVGHGVKAVRHGLLPDRAASGTHADVEMKGNQMQVVRLMIAGAFVERGLLRD